MAGGGRVHRRVVDALYTEAMLLADEARHYLDGEARQERAALDPLIRVGFSCEALKVTTRLMHIIAWLLTRRAVEAGELSEAEARSPSRRLGEVPVFDAHLVDALPHRARALVTASADLHRRVARLEGVGQAGGGEGPARLLHRRLAASF